MLRKMMLMSSTPLLIGAEEFVITPAYATGITNVIGYQKLFGQNGNLVPTEFQGHTILYLGCGSEEMKIHGTRIMFGNAPSTSAKIFIQRIDTLTTLKLEYVQEDIPAWLNPIDLFSRDDVGKEIHLLIRIE